MRIQKFPDGTVCVVSHSNNEAWAMSDALCETGFSNVYNVHPGAWRFWFKQSDLASVLAVLRLKGLTVEVEE